jgi:hypothetical protein
LEWQPGAADDVEEGVWAISTLNYGFDILFQQQNEVHGSVDKNVFVLQYCVTTMIQDNEPAPLNLKRWKICLNLNGLNLSSLEIV